MHYEAARRREPRGGAAGFTLIELLAVMLLFGLLAAIALPNLSLRSGQLALGEAKQLAASLEFARQRSVITGIPHQVVIDFDEARYWVEWLGENAAQTEEDPEDGEEPGVAGPKPIAMAPPSLGARAFRPVLGPLGQSSVLPDPVFLEGAETGAGFVEQGRIEIAFDYDGSTDAVELFLTEPEGSRLSLVVSPLADTVWINRVDD